MLKRVVLLLLTFMISFHVAGLVSSAYKTSKYLTQDSSKDFSDKETKETSEKSSDVSQELVFINQFYQNSHFLISLNNSIHFHDYIVLYQSPPKKVPSVPPSQV